MTLVSGGIFVLKKAVRYFFVVAFLLAYFVCPGTSKAQSAKDQTPVSAEKKAAVVFTEKDRTFALERLDETKTEFLNEIKDLSEAQLNFKENPERWSVAEVAEHIILAENLIYTLLTDKILQAPVPEGKDNFRIKDQAIWMVITNRSTKFNAPERIQPKGLYKSKADLISNFDKARSVTVDFVKTTKVDLRNCFGENPGIGMIDGFQWVIFLNGHSQRHLDQIKEIKADPNYPKK